MDVNGIDRQSMTKLYTTWRVPQKLWKSARGAPVECVVHITDDLDGCLGPGTGDRGWSDGHFIKYYPTEIQLKTDHI